MSPEEFQQPILEPEPISHRPPPHRHSNEFRVFRLVRGEVTEHADSWWSPVISTLEDPWGGDEGTR